MPEDAAVNPTGFGTLFEAAVFKEGQRMLPNMSAEQLRSEGSTVNWSLPWVLNSEDSASCLADVATDPLLLKEIDDARKAFLASDERRNPAKGKGKIVFRDVSMMGTLRARLWAMLSGAKVWHGINCEVAGLPFAELKNLCWTPDLFLTRGGKILPMIESASLAALKYYPKGTRQILAVKFSAIATHVRSSLAGPALKLHLSSVGTIQWLSTCTHEKLTQWVESPTTPNGCIFKSSVGPGEFLWTPPGWL